MYQNRHSKSLNETIKETDCCYMIKEIEENGDKVDINSN